MPLGKKGGGEDPKRKERELIQQMLGSILSIRSGFWVLEARKGMRNRHQGPTTRHQIERG